MKNIAIIGCGAAGTMVLANLVSKAKDGELDITVYHYGTPLSRGIAYSTKTDGHLLNVVASEMGIWVGNKNDFFEWLQHNHYNNYHERSFVPRKLFGEYLEDKLRQTNELAKKKSIRISFIEEEVTELPDHFDHICLALGNKLKAFDVEETIDLEAAKHIVIAGTGLSMIDMVVWLDEQNYRGKLSLISTHGNLPYAYSFETRVTVKNTVEIGDDLLTVLKKYEEMVERYKDWRSVIDSFRPISNRIWQAWSLVDRQKFLSEYNSEWGIRRHKIAVEIDQQVRDFFSKIELEQIQARLDRVIRNGKKYVAILANGQQIQCDAVVNCMGLNLNPAAHELYSVLIAKGELKVSDVGVGVIPPQRNNLHIIGSALIGYLFESVAIPDLRLQAEAIADNVLFN